MDRFPSMFLLGNFLKRSPSDFPSEFNHSRCFDTTSKRGDASGMLVNTIALNLGQYATHNILFGQLKLFGWIISMEFFYYYPDKRYIYRPYVKSFQPSIDCIANVVIGQQKNKSDSLISEFSVNCLSSFFCSEIWSIFTELFSTLFSSVYLAASDWLFENSWLRGGFEIYVWVPYL